MTLKRYLIERSDDFGISAKKDDGEKLELLIGLLRDISGTLQPGDPMKERILDTLVKQFWERRPYVPSLL